MDQRKYIHMCMSILGPFCLGLACYYSEVHSAPVMPFLEQGVNQRHNFRLFSHSLLFSPSLSPSSNLFMPVIILRKVCPETSWISNRPLVQLLIVFPAVDATPCLVWHLYETVSTVLYIIAPEDFSETKMIVLSLIGLVYSF